MDIIIIRISHSRVEQGAMAHKQLWPPENNSIKLEYFRTAVNTQITAAPTAIQDIE